MTDFHGLPLIPVPEATDPPVHGPDTLFEHLTRKLDEGGHFLDPDGSLVLIDHLYLHEWDHEPDRWWSDALMHTHTPEQAEGWRR